MAHRRGDEEDLVLTTASTARRWVARHSVAGDV